MLNGALLIETALLVLAAYLLGCVLGYGLRRVLHAARGTRPVGAIAPPVAVPEPRRVPSPGMRLAASVDDEAPTPLPTRLPRPRAVDARPKALLGPRDGLGDNLKQIKGIGPKIEASLHDLGIFHLDQIAAWTRAEADWVDSQLAFKGRIRRERWVEQAGDMAQQPKAQAG